jgi:hypothetical protein
MAGPVVVALARVAVMDWPRVLGGIEDALASDLGRALEGGSGRRADPPSRELPMGWAVCGGGLTDHGHRLEWTGGRLLTRAFR